MSKFPERLRVVMASRKTTQAELAKLIGVTPGTLSAYLKDGEGRKVPTLDTLERISQRLGVSIGWLCGEDDPDSLFVNGQLSYAKIIKVINQLLALGGGHLFSVDIGCSYGLDGEPKKDLLEVFTTDEQLTKYYADHVKVFDLYKNNTIDREMYDAWVEKRLRHLESLEFDDDELPF